MELTEQNFNTIRRALQQAGVSSYRATDGTGLIVLWNDSEPVTYAWGETVPIG